MFLSFQVEAPTGPFRTIATTVEVMVTHHTSAAGQVEEPTVEDTTTMGTEFMAMEIEAAEAKETMDGRTVAAVGTLWTTGQTEPGAPGPLDGPAVEEETGEASTEVPQLLVRQL